MLLGSQIRKDYKVSKTEVNGDLDKKAYSQSVGVQAKSE